MDLSKSPRKWLWIWGLWTVVAIFFASQSSLQTQLSENPVPLWRILSWQITSCYVWLLLTPVILYLSGRFPFEKGSWKRAVPIHLAASVVVACLQLAINAWILPNFGYLRRFQPKTYLETYRIFLLVNLHFAVFIYWAVVGIHQAARYYQKYRERELQTSQLEARLAQSRLQVLKMQLHPHFLFNTLNAISELVYKDRELAEQMLTNLSDLLRLSFEQLETQEVTLKQELDFLKKYLEIEQMRFQDRLAVEMNIAPETLEAKVPNMILQPLVENAIKHGLSPRSEGGSIDISASRSNGDLRLTVTDNGIGLGKELSPAAEGVGISNTRRRLFHLYGEHQRFELRPAAPNGVRVELDIPFSTGVK